MRKLEQKGSTATGHRGAFGPILHSSNPRIAQAPSSLVTPRFSLLSMVPARPGPSLVTTPLPRRQQLLGRKGRQVLARRRALDGAYFTIAMGAAALLWWSTL